MRTDLVVMFVVAVTVATAAPADQAASDDYKVYPLSEQQNEDFKIYQRPMPVDGFNTNNKPQGADFKIYQRPMPVDGFNADQQEAESFKIYQRPQPVGGFGGDQPRPVGDFKFFKGDDDSDAWGFNFSGFDFFGAQDPWGTLEPQKQIDNPRPKREVCWLGVKACTIFCKIFGQGAKVGSCATGTCMCYFPKQFPGYPNYTGR